MLHATKVEERRQQYEAWKKEWPESHGQSVRKDKRKAYGRMSKGGRKVFIMICDRMPNIEGQIDERPIAVFRNMSNARKFLRILAVNGIFACVKMFELEAAICT